VRAGSGRSTLKMSTASGVAPNTASKTASAPGCGCEEMLDEMAEGDPADPLEEHADGPGCPLGDWDEGV